jgi:hypothetical protein
MSYRLPDIQVKVDINLYEFLEQMQNLALETKNFHSELHKDFMGQGYDILDLNPQFTTPHVGLFGQLIVAPGKREYVIVEMKADHWNPEPPSYEMYVGSAKDVIAPLLKSYNSIFKTKYRLSIQSAESLKPKLPPRANQRFNEFVGMANKQILHPLDWKRFYFFIYACSSRNIKTSQDDVKELLLSAGFSDDVTDTLASIFWHGVSLLRLASK